MKSRLPGSAAFTGAVLVVLYTLVSASSDTAAKYISTDFAAPQLFALSGGLVALISLIGAGRKGNLSELRSAHPVPIAIRSISTVVSACLFFYAFRELSLAEVFVFVGLMPIMAALLTPTILKERVDARAWVALLAGFVGIICLFPEGIAGITIGHAIAFAACLTGVVSMVMARLVSKTENKPLALLFYPHLLMFVTMAAVLPFVFKPMTSFDLAIAGLYSALLFVGRFILVRALALASTHVVLPIMNVQFIWMVGYGALVFAEIPTINVVLGAAIVIASCLYLVHNANVAEQKKIPKIPSELATSGWPRSRNLSRSHRSSWRSGSRSRIVRQSALR